MTRTIKQRYLEEAPEDQPHGHVWHEGRRWRVPLDRLPDGQIARHDTWDIGVWKEVPKSYGWLPVAGQVVLDVGVNVGYFSSMALRKGAKRVVGYEPDINAVDIAWMNAPDADIRQAALVSGHEKSVDLYVGGFNSGGNTIARTVRGRHTVSVPTANFLEVLEEVRPTVIKMDCEGAEYDLLSQGLPDFVKHVSIEIHAFGVFAPSAFPLISAFDDWYAMVEPDWNSRSAKRHKCVMGGWSR